MKNLFSHPAQPVSEHRAVLGETPVWCDFSHSLLWVDILAGTLQRYWPDQSERTEIRTLPRFTSAVLLTSEPECFLLVSQQGIGFYHYRSGEITPLCNWPENASGTRPNEAAIAPDGALWFSSMDPQAKSVIGSWYRLESGQTVPQKLLGNLWVPNTLQWWGEDVWFADSLKHCLYRASFMGGSLTVTQTFNISGIPDGSALTQDGLLINARWGEACLCVSQLGAQSLQEKTHVVLPVEHPTSCTFGGETLSDLYITSARDGLVMPSATDGALLRITTTLTGKPACRFRL